MIATKIRILLTLKDLERLEECKQGGEVAGLVICPLFSHSTVDLLSASYVPGTILGTGYTAVKKTDKFLPSLSSYFSGRERQDTLVTQYIR